MRNNFMGGGEVTANYGGLLPNVNARPMAKGLPPNRGNNSAISSSMDQGISS